MLALLAFLFGCSGGSAADSCDPAAASGTITAAVDGEDWTGEGLTWLWSGASVQLTSSGTDRRITAVGHRDAAGTDVADLMDALPVSVSLDDNDGWALLYEGNASDRSVTGTLTLTDYVEDGDLVGCISFETEGGASVSSGSFSAAYFGD